MSDDLSIVINLATVQYLTLVSDRDPSNHLSIYLYMDGFTPIHKLSDHSSSLFLYFILVSILHHRIRPIYTYSSYILLFIHHPPSNAISSNPSCILLSILYPSCILLSIPVSTFHPISILYTPNHPVFSYPSCILLSIHLSNIKDE